VPWRGAFGENIAVSPAAAVWRHKFLGTTKGLHEHFLCGWWRKIYRENVDDGHEQS